MKQDRQDYKYCINLAIENANRRIRILNKLDRKSILDEYEEWIKDDFNDQTVLLLREDPII